MPPRHASSSSTPRWFSSPRSPARRPRPSASRAPLARTAKPGDGPRRKMRDDDAAASRSPRTSSPGRAAAVKGDMAALDGDLAKIATGDASTIDRRNPAPATSSCKALSRQLDMTVIRLQRVRTDPQLKQLRADLAERAERTALSAIPRQAASSVPDATESGAAGRRPRHRRAAGAGEARSSPPSKARGHHRGRPRRLLRRSTACSRSKCRPRPTSCASCRSTPSSKSKAPPRRPTPPKAAASVEARLRPSPSLHLRRHLPAAGFYRPAHEPPAWPGAEKRARPSAAPSSKFSLVSTRSTAIKASGENFELFRHVVFDVAGAYYVAVPLDAPQHLDSETREALRVEPQLLANLFARFEQRPHLQAHLDALHGRGAGRSAARARNSPNPTLSASTASATALGRRSSSAPSWARPAVPKRRLSRSALPPASVHLQGAIAGSDLRRPPPVKPPRPAARPSNPGRSQDAGGETPGREVRRPVWHSRPPCPRPSSPRSRRLSRMRQSPAMPANSNTIPPPRRRLRVAPRRMVSLRQAQSSRVKSGVSAWQRRRHLEAGDSNREPPRSMLSPVSRAAA